VDAAVDDLHDVQGVTLGRPSLVVFDQFDVSAVTDPPFTG
jgi:hypothetical protein